MEKHENLKTTWFVLGAFVIAVCLVSLAYLDTVQAMVTTWYEAETYTHCFFIVPAFIYFVWNKRSALHGVPEPSALGLLPLAAFGFLWLLGAFADVSLVKQFAITGMVVSITAGLLGVKLSRQLVFPLCFLFLSVPVGEELLPVMMDFTATFTVTTLKFFGYPVFREGNFFSLPTGNWSVVEACSGVRYLIASVTMGLVYAYITYVSFYKRFLFVLVSVIVPVIANGLRAVMIVLLGHYSGMTIATGVDHLIYGWLFFGVVIFILFWIGSRWQEDMDTVSAGENPDSTGATATRPLLHWKSFTVAGLLLIMVLIWPVRYNQVVTRVPEQSPAHLLSFAKDYAVCTDCRADYEPDFNEADHYIKKSFRLENGQPVYVFIASYYSWSQKGELVSYQNRLILPADSNHRIISQKEEGSVIRTLSRVREKWLTSHWYQVVAFAPGKKQALSIETMTSRVKVKMWEAWNRLAGRHYISQLVAVYTPMDSPGDPEAGLHRFLADEKDQLTQTSGFH